MTFRLPYKRLIRAALMLCALLLLLGNALILWVSTGPRSVQVITPYIETALAPPGSGYKISISSSELAWDGWKHPISVRIKNVDVMNEKGAVVATFPEVGVGLRFFHLLIGKISLKSLELLHPSIVLEQKEDGTISFGFSATVPQPQPSEQTSLADALGLFLADEGTNPVTHMTSLVVRHANLSIKRLREGVLLRSPDASLDMMRKHGTVKGTLSMPLQFDKKDGEIDGEFSIDGRKKEIVTEVTYTDIPSGMLRDLFPAQQWMETVHMPLAGWAYITSDFNANIKDINFLLEAGTGTIDYPSEFPEPLQLNSIHVEGRLTDDLNTLTVRKGALRLHEIAIGFDGIIHKQGNDYSLDGHAETGNLPIDHLQKYWPSSLAPHTRSWVTTRVSKGVVHKASVTAHFKPGELKLKDTPEQAVSAAVDVKGATVLYLPKHPPVSDISGLVRFTGKAMEAKISSGKYMSATQIKFANVRFPDLNADKVRLFLDIALSSTAKDAVEFMSLPELDKARALNLTPAVTGNVDGTVRLDFTAFSDENTSKSAPMGSDINYAIAAKLINVTQPRFLHARDVADANMDINISNKGIEASGEAKIDQLPMTIDLVTSFKAGNKTDYTIQCDMPVSRLPDFNLPAIDFAKGIIGVDAKFTSSDSEEKAQATLNLMHTSIALPTHGFNKPLNEPATLKITTEKTPSGNTLIKSFLLDGKGYSASGNAEFNKAAGDFASLYFNKLRMGNQDLDNLEYTKVQGGIKLTARGRSFDASPYLFKGNGNGLSQSYVVDMRTDRLIFGQGRELKDVSVQANCAAQCRMANINAKLPDGVSFLYTIANGKLNSNCDNAGELFRILGISENIAGGKVQITGSYSTGKLEGTAVMTDYTLRKAPILTKMFTIASLTGILDTLSGNGIAFTKLLAPFTYQHDVITLKEAKAHGPALGITADGTIDMQANNFDLKGTLVPSYTLNSLVGNIPLIGDVLMGGKGKGLIALNYTVKGAMKDPSVSVNPLSALTPGFLRGIFDIFDQPPPDLDKIEADRKKALEKEKEQEKVAQPPAAPPVPSANPASPMAP